MGLERKPNNRDLRRVTIGGLKRLVKNRLFRTMALTVGSTAVRSLFEPANSYEVSSAMAISVHASKEILKSSIGGNALQFHLANQEQREQALAILSGLLGDGVTYMFGGALAGSPTAYIQFLLPGILVQTIIFITVYTGVGLNTDIQKGLFDRFRSLPMWQPAPIIGALAGDLFRYSVASTLIVVLGLILGFRPAGGAVGVLLAFGLVLLFAVALSWIWIIFGMKVKTPESVMTTSFIFLMPLTFASNIFVGLETMPPWLQAIVRHNPVTHLANASRGLMHGQAVGSDILWVLVASAAIVLVAAPVALRMYITRRGDRPPLRR